VLVVQRLHNGRSDLPRTNDEDLHAGRLLRP
jgi:hypothetical protein